MDNNSWNILKHRKHFGLPVLLPPPSAATAILLAYIVRLQVLLRNCGRLCGCLASPPLPPVLVQSLRCPVP